MRKLLVLLIFISGCTLFERDPLIRPNSDVSDSQRDMSDASEPNEGDAGDAIEDATPDLIDSGQDAHNDVSKDTSMDVAEDVTEDAAPIAAPNWSNGFEFVLTYDSVQILQNTGAGPDDLVNDLAFPIAPVAGVFNGGGNMDRSTSFIASSGSNYTDFSTGLTLGTWMRVTRDSINSPDLVLLNDDPTQSGASLSMYGDGRSVCWGSDGVSTGATETDNAWTLGEWVHLACVYDPASDRTIAFVDGVATTVSSAGLLAGDPAIKFRIGNRPGTGGFEGDLDETFVMRQALGATQIKRLTICGIDGSNCTCKSRTPTEYADCGGEDCSGLPACNATLP